MIYTLGSHFILILNQKIKWKMMWCGMDLLKIKFYKILKRKEIYVNRNKI